MNIKNIVAIMVVLLVIPSVFATERVGARITTYEGSDKVVDNAYVVLDADSSNLDDVTVCATPDGSHPKVVVNAKGKASWGKAIAKANEMLVNWAKYPQLSSHYYCARERF